MGQIYEAGEKRRKDWRQWEVEVGIEGEGEVYTLDGEKIERRRVNKEMKGMPPASGW